MTSAAHQVQAIVAAHAALGLESHADPQAMPAANTPEAIAFAAARRLGFIEADAVSIAQAWRKQSERTGQWSTGTWPTFAADFGLLAGTLSTAFLPCPELRGLYPVLPTASWVGRMARAGVRSVQLRFKSNDPAAVRHEIDAAVAAVQGTACRLYINDHWQEAIRAGAYGVHLGQEDLDAADLGAIRQAGLRLGISTHGYAEMQTAHRLQPSYIAMGAVYATTLKHMPTPPQGPARLSAYAQLLQGMPLVAIGGIDRERLPAIAVNGITAFAVVRAITASHNPEHAAQQLEHDFETAFLQKNQALTENGKNGTII